MVVSDFFSNFVHRKNDIDMKIRIKKKMLNSYCEFKNFTKEDIEKVKREKFRKPSTLRFWYSRFCKLRKEKVDMKLTFSRDNKNEDGSEEDTEN